MKFLIIIFLIVLLILIKSIHDKIIIRILFLPIYYFLSCGLFVISFFIIYKYSFTLLDFLIISLVSFCFLFSLKSQGIGKSSIYKPYSSPLSIKFSAIKNIEVIKNSKYPKCRVTAYGTYYDFYFKDYESIESFKKLFKTFTKLL